MVTVASSLLTGAPLPDCKTTEASLPSLSLLGGGFPHPQGVSSSLLASLSSANQSLQEGK